MRCWLSLALSYYTLSIGLQLSLKPSVVIHYLLKIINLNSNLSRVFVFAFIEESTRRNNGSLSIESAREPPPVKKDTLNLIKTQYHKNSFFFIIACCCCLVTKATPLSTILVYLIDFARFTQFIGHYNEMIKLCYAADFAAIFMTFVILCEAISNA